MNGHERGPGGDRGPEEDVTAKKTGRHPYPQNRTTAIERELGRRSLDGAGVTPPRAERKPLAGRDAPPDRQAPDRDRPQERER